MISLKVCVVLVTLSINLVQSQDEFPDNSGKGSGNLCPPAEMIRPCTCDTNSKTLRCFSTIDFDLEQVFKAVSQHQNDEEIKWNVLELNLPTLKELKDSIFNGISFRTLKLIHCSKLNCVSPTAFQGMERIIENFVSYETSFANADKHGCNVFDALKRLKSLRSVNITGSKIREIPRNAFYELGVDFHHLTHVDFSGNQGGEITKIGRNAFASLKALKFLDFSQHQVSRIDSHAFYIEEPSNDYLTIDLESNLLTSESFEVDSFAINGRITTVKIGGNPNLQVLKESIWRSFLLNTGRSNPAEQNLIDLRGTPLACNRQNLWILEHKYRLHRKVIHVLSAESGSEFWKHTPGQCDK